jgi:aspartyl-tRNA(Asn)/glutamyl-tRNA(Gln) amidotransferase subunit C
MITPEEIRRIADLARLKLPEDKIPQYADQLARILDYVGMLNEIDTKDVAPMLHATHEDNVFRDDTVAPGLTREQALANAADQDGTYLRVPKTV